MALFGKLLSGVLTDIQDVPAARTWGDGGTDVPLASLPTFIGPYGYDGINQVATSNPAQDRANAAAEVTANDQTARLFRSVAKVLVDEINALRDWITAFKATVAAATSLATTQEQGIGARMPDRTLAQAKTAIQAAANSSATDGG